MAFFGLFGKEEKKEEGCGCGTVPSCSCGGNSCGCGSSEDDTTSNYEGVKNIKILGAGCKSCHQQYEIVKGVVAELDLPIEVEYITDMETVVTYGVMTIPALVFDGKVIASGKVLKAEDIKKLIMK